MQVLVRRARTTALASRLLRGGGASQLTAHRNPAWSDEGCAPGSIPRHVHVERPTQCRRCGGSHPDAAGGLYGMRIMPGLRAASQARHEACGACGRSSRVLSAVRTSGRTDALNSPATTRSPARLARNAAARQLKTPRSRLCALPGTKSRCCRSVPSPCRAFSGDANPGSRRPGGTVGSEQRPPKPGFLPDTLGKDAKSVYPC